MIENEIADAMQEKGAFSIVRHTLSVKQWRVMGRVPPQAKSKWKALRVHLLRCAKLPTCPWQIDISQQFFLQGDEEVYGWRIIFSTNGQAMEPLLPGILSAIQALQVGLAEERGFVPLGVPAGRNDVNNARHPGKGAQPAGRAIVGAAAAAAWRGR